MPKIVPFLWFNDQAKAAAEFYVSVFSDSARPGSPKDQSRMITVTPLVVEYQLDDQRFMALNGGPAHAGFTETVSFLINCETQEEVDYFWDKLIAGGGRPDRCGWLKDRFGLSWQIVPEALGKFMSDPDDARRKRVMEALLKMNKLEIAGLREAYDRRE